MQKIKKSENEPSIVYRIVKFIGQLYLMWPLDNNAKWINRILRELFWWIFMINGSILFVGIILGTIYFYCDISSFITLIFIVFELTLICETMYTSILFKIKEPHFKILLSFLDDNLNNVNSPDEIIFRRYLKDSTPLAISMYSMYNVMAVVFFYLQLFKPTLILPKEIWYPFPTEPFMKKILVLIQQLLYIFHSGVIHVGDGILFISLHIARAKLAVLSNEFQLVVDEVQLKKCIQQHQEVIWFVKQINITSRFIILKTVMAVASYLTLGYLQLLHQKESADPLLVQQFLLVIAVVNYRMYFGTLCADSLVSMGENLRYSIPWAGKSSGVSKSMCLVIQRCQKPLTISVTGIISQYSLWYYANFLYKTFSYFLTLKAVLGL